MGLTYDCLLYTSSIWYDLYKETALRNGLYINDIEYFSSVLTAKADDTASPARVELLLAEHEGEPLAAIFLVMSGHRGTYLYGASSSRKRNYMPTYALQWEAIKIAKEYGCTEYDMFGVSPGPDPVSYTHLDVYKRQALYPAGPPPIIAISNSIVYLLIVSCQKSSFCNVYITHHPINK